MTDDQPTSKQTTPDRPMVFRASYVVNEDRVRMDWHDNEGLTQRMMVSRDNAYSMMRELEEFFQHVRR